MINWWKKPNKADFNIFFVIHIGDRNKAEFVFLPPICCQVTSVDSHNEFNTDTINANLPVISSLLLICWYITKNLFTGY